ncbi:MAG: glycosyltransferase family 2 protein [Treponema sp.]|nr:glycosyltransferase family 2 protein [Treponema sp.]
MKKISTIVPVYNEEKNVPLMLKALQDVAAKLPAYNFEFLFVNDGSRDGSWEELEKAHKADSRVVSIDLTRNFGKELALTAGVRNCTGDAAIFLDADLQHPPELIPQFVEKWENGAEVVASVRKSTKKKSLIKNLGSKLFYKIMRYCGTGITPNTTDFKLIDRKVINELVKFTEHKRMFRGLIEWLGFRTEYIEFVAPERINGVASYSVSKLVRLAVYSMVSYSLLPLKLTSYLGFLIAAVSFCLMCVMCVVRFVYRSPFFSPISFVIVTNTLILGIILTAFGFLALYISQIQTETMNRPLYVVREKLDK